MLNSYVDFNNIPLNELLDTLKYKLDFDTSEFSVSTESEVQLQSLTVNSIINLLKERLVEGNLDGISINSKSVVVSSITGINRIIADFFSDRSIAYVKRINLSNEEGSNFSLKVTSKIGISAKIVFDMPISFGKDLVLRLKVVNEAKVVLKIINTFSNKIKFEKGYLVIDLKPLLQLPEIGNYILNDWLNSFEGRLYLEGEDIKLSVLANNFRLLNN